MIDYVWIYWMDGNIACRTRDGNDHRTGPYFSTSELPAGAVSAVMMVPEHRQTDEPVAMVKHPELGELSIFQAYAALAARERQLTEELATLKVVVEQLKKRNCDE